MATEYPKRMAHPSHQPAEWKTRPKGEKDYFEPDSVQIRAETLPDIIVVNEKEEQFYAARGYRPVGNFDPIEYEKSMIQATVVRPEGYQFTEYPKFLYHPIHAPKLLQNEEEEKELLSTGETWYEHPVSATEDDLALIESEPPRGVRMIPGADPAKLDKRTRAYKDWLSTQKVNVQPAR